MTSLCMFLLALKCMHMHAVPLQTPLPFTILDPQTPKCKKSNACLQGEPPSLDAFTDFFKGFRNCHKIVIDCTANAQVPSYYARWLSTGIHVVTPNKKLCSGPMDEWTKVRDTCREHNTLFMYEVRSAALCCAVAFNTWELLSRQYFDLVIQDMRTILSCKACCLFMRVGL